PPARGARSALPGARPARMRPPSRAPRAPRRGFPARALVRREPRCPHCGGDGLETLARKYALVRIRRCRDCALVFTDPIYRSRLGSLYDQLYAGEGSTTELPDAARLAALVAAGVAGSDKDFRAPIARLREVAPGPRLLEIGSSWGYFLHQAGAAGFAATGI